MKRNFFFFIVFISLVLLSCASKRATEPVVITNTKETVKTIKDTTYVVKADSTFYNAYIECVNGKPVLKEPVTKGSAKKESGLQTPKVNLVGNQLTVECEKKAQELYKQWRETYIKEHEQTPVYIKTPVEVVKPLSWWQKTQIWFGRIFIGILTFFILIGVLRWKQII